MLKFDLLKLRYGPLNTFDIAKTVALILMLIDHIGAYFFPYDLHFRAIGRGACIVFFFITGYNNSYKIKFDLVLLAMLLTFIHHYYGHRFFHMDILVSFIIIKALLQLLDKYSANLKTYDYVAIILLLVYLYPTTYIIEYGNFGMMYAFLGYAFRRNIFSSITLKCLLAITSMSYLVYESLNFSFAIDEIIAASICVSIITAGISYFRSKPLSLGLINPLILLCGRNILYLYILHIIAFNMLTQ